MKTAKIKNTFRTGYKYRELLLMMLPGFLVLLLFAYLPMGGTIIAFKDYKIMKGILGSEWVGLKHFKTLFDDPKFLSVLANTMRFSITKIILGIPVPIILALLLNELKNMYYKKIVQTITYLPHFFSWVMLGGMFKLVFSNTGPVNELIAVLGGQPIAFFAGETSFFWLIIGSSLWASAGWGSIVYMAALSGIDPSLYEAAEMDGASRWKQVLHITLPALIPTMVVVTILNLSNVLNAGFDQIYNMQNPLVYNISDILETYNLRKLQTMDYSYGTAVGMFKGVVAMVLVLGTNALSKKYSDNGLW